ncbi:hypothetical protein J4Q44_G00338550, partial [Coregonus suidteri]
HSHFLAWPLPLLRRVEGGGGGGRKGADDSPASGQCGGGSTSSSSVPSAPLYRTHGMHIHTEDMESLSERTAACSIREPGGGTQSPQPVEEEVDIEGVKLRLVSNGERKGSTPLKVESICNSLNIVKNIAFLYQEYRDTSKQQEIEQRRQQDGLTLGVSAGPMFELVTSEASYYKKESGGVLETHFPEEPCAGQHTQPIRHALPVLQHQGGDERPARRFLMDLEKTVSKQSLQISEVCDIVHHHAVKHFHVFITYVINQVYQEKNYRRILQGNQSFSRGTWLSLEEPAACPRPSPSPPSSSSPSTRSPRLKITFPEEGRGNSEREAHAIKVSPAAGADCEGVQRGCEEDEFVQRNSSALRKHWSSSLSRCRWILPSRWLLKKGEVQQMAGPKSTRTMRSKKLHHPVLPVPLQQPAAHHQAQLQVST